MSLPILFAQEEIYEPIENSLLSGLDTDQRFVIVLVVVGCTTLLLIALSAILSGTYYSLQRRRGEMELKQDMLDRGMTAEEIAEVIKAAPIEDAASRWVEGWKQRKKI